MTNPLLQDWDTPFQIAPFDKISDDDFAPALDEALQTHRMEIDAIADCEYDPTFSNTIEALEEAGSQRRCSLRISLTSQATRSCLRAWPPSGKIATALI